MLFSLITLLKNLVNTKINKKDIKGKKDILEKLEKRKIEYSGLHQ